MPAFKPGSAHVLRVTGGQGSIDGHVETQTWEHTGTGQRLDLVQPRQRRKTAVGHTGKRTPRQLAHYEADHLPGAPSRCDGSGHAAHRSAQRDTKPSARAAPSRGWPRIWAAAPYSPTSAGHSL